jgi:hypothetical protein
VRWSVPAGMTESADDLVQASAQDRTSMGTNLHRSLSLALSSAPGALPFGRNSEELCVDLAGDDLAQVPWEQLRRAPGSSVRIVIRRLPAAGTVDPRPVSGPLRVLILDTGQLGPGCTQPARRLDATAVSSAVQELARNGYASIDVRVDVSWEDLKLIVETASAEGRRFHALHVIGDIDGGQRPGVWFRTRHGRVESISVQRLAKALGAAPPAVVMFSVPSSAAPVGFLHAAAAELTTRQVPACVVLPTGDPRGAIKQCHGLYDTLVRAGALAPALSAATQAAPDEPEPLAVVQTESGEILARQDHPRRWRRRVSAVANRSWRRVSGAAAVVVAITVLSGAGDTVKKSAATLWSPERMASDVRVVVADFRVRGHEEDLRGLRAGSEVAATLATSLEDRVHAIGASLDVEVRGPDESDATLEGPGSGADAAALAARHNANIVVFGSVGLQGDEAVVDPEIWLDAALLPGAEELAGVHELGAPFQVALERIANPVLLAQLRKETALRVGAFASVAVGLGLYAAEDYLGAEQALRDAAGVRGLNTGSEGRMLELFLGNVAGKLGRLDEAADEFGSALDDENEFARARVGLAEVAFHRASGRICAPGGTDADGLRAALAQFDHADRVLQPDSLVPALKVGIGRARAYLCLSQSGAESRWTDAEREYRSVIATGEHTATATPVVAEAWAGLALLAYPRSDAAKDPDAYREVVARIGRALALARNTRRERAFLEIEADALMRAGAAAEARRSQREADALPR